MVLSPRIVLLALLLLVLPAAFTALFLSRHAHPAVQPDAQPGGVIAGRLVARDVATAGTGAATGGVDLEIAGVAADGSSSIVARGTTAADGSFEVQVPPFDGLYEVRVAPGDWQAVAWPVSLVAEPGAGTAVPVEVPVHAAARLELAFARRSGPPVRGGEWTIDGEAGRSWLSAWGGRRVERSGSFAGPELAVEGLPPMRARVVVRLAGGGRTELVIDLRAGPNRHTVDL